MRTQVRLVVVGGIAVLALVAAGVWNLGDLSFWNDDPSFTPVDVGADLIADVAYRVEGLPADDAQRFDIYLPPDRPRSIPAVVWIHGGGWTLGDKTDGMGPWDWTERGVAVVSVNYRLAGDQSTIGDAAVDVSAALDHLVERAEDWGIDPDRIGVYGHSAGGHLAALLAVGDAGVVGAFAAGAPLDLVSLLDARTATFVGLEGPDAVRYVGDALGCELVDDRCRSRAAELSPSRRTTDATPMLVLHGDADRFVSVDQAERFASAHADNSRVEVRIVADADHVTFRSEAEEFLLPLLFA